MISRSGKIQVGIGLVTGRYWGIDETVVDIPLPQELNLFPDETGLFPGPDEPWR